MSKYSVFYGPYFPVFIPKTGNFGPEKTPYLDTFHAVLNKKNLKTFIIICYLVAILCH